MQSPSMHLSPRSIAFVALIAVIVITPWILAQDPPAPPQNPAVEIARDQAKVLHEVLHSTLKVIHRRYFHEDRAVIPARAMEDIFDEMKHEGHFEARWIAVNLRAMGIDHEPANEFEKNGAEALKNGKPEYELVDDKTYRRVAPIPLQNGCIGCHEGGLRSSGSKGKLAALVISIPLESQSSSENR
ncbi:MAG: DUF3365 domain-containing protein [Planctomycetaceae bacterium]|nr:DUF3365 domain-containing protein [Planctomycetaceae bacterium]